MTAAKQDWSWKSFIWDFLFVVLLPLLCFVLDPIFIEWPEPTRYALYALVTTLSVMFWLSCIPKRVQWFNQLLNGSLLLGALLASAIGVLLLPMTLIGLFFIIGMLGLVPFGTAWRFKTRFFLNGGGLPRTSSAMILLSLGVMLPLFFPAILYREIDKRLERDIQAVRDRDPIIASVALKNLGENWFCQKNCASRVSQMFLDNGLTIPEPDFRRGFLDAMGEDYDSWNLND
jgi:hypothetical protein